MTARRLLVVLALAVGLVLPTSPAATALTRSTIRIDTVDGFVATRAMAPGERVVFDGGVTRSTGRVVVLQRFTGGAWREVGRHAARNSWQIAVSVPAVGRHSYRAVALRTASASSAVSATRVLTVVRPSISHTSARSVEVGRLLTVAGAAVPARAGRMVQLWELRGPRWVPLADTSQSTSGTFALRIRAGTIGRHTYRVVTLAPDHRFTVRSVTTVVTTVKASTSGVRASYLADVTPLGALIGQDDQGPLYAVSTATIAGRAYVKSVRTASHRFSYELGAGASTFGTALNLAPVTRVTNLPGARLFEVRVDGVLRVRRFIAVGQVVPVTLDVRGKKVVTIAATPADPVEASDVLLATPVVTSEIRSERGVDTGTALRLI